MTNPFTPPDSNLISEADRLRYEPAFAWKVYFWINVFFSVLGMLIISGGLKLLLEQMEDIPISGYDLTDTIVWGMMLFALFGMAWKRRVISRRFWRNYLWLFLIWNVIYTLLLPFVLNIPAYGEVGDMQGFLYGLPFTLLNLYALYRYGFSMDYVWKSSEEVSIQ